MSVPVLKLLQLVSPALPVGAFSYSEGLEVLVQEGRLADAAAVAAWLEAELVRGAVRLEAAALPLLGQALVERNLSGLRELEGWLLAQREAPELRAQQRQMGRSLGQLLAELGWPLPVPPAITWPVAFAWAGLCFEIPGPALVEAYLYGWAANQLSAAVRLVPLGPTEGQRLQLVLAPRIAAEAQLLAARDPRSLWSGGVGAGLAQLRHAELYSRLFRS